MIDENQKSKPEILPELDPGVSQPSYLNQLVGLFQTVSSAPSSPPRFLQDQIQIYVNGSTYRLYWWDNAGQTWHYVTATA